eukprot:scaffold137727_cov35-Tisochrysis_lutea.AAC.6
MENPSPMTSVPPFAEADAVHGRVKGGAEAAAATAFAVCADAAGLSVAASAAWKRPPVAHLDPSAGRAPSEK